MRKKPISIVEDLVYAALLIAAIAVVTLSVVAGRDAHERAGNVVAESTAGPLPRFLAGVGKLDR